MDGICRKTGFLAVSGHGVSKATIEAIWTKAEAFFALPLEQKLAAKARYPGYPYGYLPPQSESLARSRGVEAPPDQKESFNGGPERAPASLSDPEALGFCFAPTIWPEAPPGFHEAWRAYYRAMEDLAARIMGVFALALKLPEDFFASFIDAPVSALRALNYPALSAPAKPGRIRAGAHTDYGSLTILLPQAGSRGLEILTPDARWVEVPPRPGAFVVNIGDLMARWTNDRWISTLHRVVIPEDGGASGASPSPSSISRTGTPRSSRSTPAFRRAKRQNIRPSARGPISWASSGRRRPSSRFAGLCPPVALAFPLRLPYMPRHSTGGFYAAPDSRRRSGGEGSLASHDPPRLNRTRTSVPWLCQISPCANCSRRARISATSRIAGTRRWRPTSTARATRSISSTSPRPCRCSIRR